VIVQNRTINCNSLLDVQTLMCVSEPFQHLPPALRGYARNMSVHFWHFGRAVLIGKREVSVHIRHSAQQKAHLSGPFKGKQG
jgi:hypothetical protein